MTTAFVLGNGISRRAISLESLRKHGMIYGCNALYREFVPDVLVSTDRPISTQIQETGYAVKNRYHTRKPIEGLGAKSLIKDYYGFSSGPNALGLAARDQHSTIYLLGFDMGPTPQQTFNNIYADTEFYKKSLSQPTFTGNWIKQICQVMKDYPETRFVRVCGETTARIQELDAAPNLRHEPIEVFLERINKQKDL